MNAATALKVIKELRDKGEYFDLHPTSCCLDGGFTLEQLKAIVYVMEHDIWREV